MTSVLRRYAQIEPRIKYMTVIDDCSGWTLDVNQSSSSLMDISSFTYAMSPTINYGSGYLLQDLGRQITVYNSAPSVQGSPHVAIFRQVMQVNGPNMEGTSTNIAYICVWNDGSATFPLAFVARTG